MRTLAVLAAKSMTILNSVATELVEETDLLIEPGKFCSSSSIFPILLVAGGRTSFPPESDDTLSRSIAIRLSSLSSLGHESYRKTDSIMGPSSPICAAIQ